jgi:hypothetical protein
MMMILGEPGNQAAMGEEKVSRRVASLYRSLAKTFGQKRRKDHTERLSIYRT